MRRRRTAFVAGAAAVLLITVIAVMAIALGASRGRTVTPKADTTYFVASTACSNEKSGTSPTRAWCDPKPLDGQRLKPGTRLLFACGGVWKEPGGSGEHPYLSLSGRGTTTRPIIVGGYDPTSGKQTACSRKPRLEGGDARSELLVVENPDHWRIDDLELARGAVGLRVHFTTTGHQDVQLDGLTVHDFKGIFRGDCAVWPHAYTALGVLFDHTLARVPPRPTAVLNGIRVTGLEGYHNQGSLGILGYGCAKTTSTSSYLYHSVQLRDLHLHDDSGPAPACSDGLQLISASAVQVLDSRFEGEGGCFTDSGTTGVILGEVSDVSFVNDVFARTPTTRSPDQSGMDLEAHTRDVSIRGSYFGENSGAGLEILTITGDANYQTGFLVSDNLFAANSRAPLAGTGEGGHIWRTGASPEPSGTIRDNLYSDEIPFISGSLPGVTVSDNLGGAETTSSAAEFERSGTDWSAESAARPGKWHPLVLDGNEYRDAVGTTAVSRFDLRGPACATCAVARVWTARRTGTVSIRGVAQSLSADASGITVRIESEGTPLLTRALSSAAATATGLDHLHVEAGQRIRFAAVLPHGGEVSWTPSLLYER